MPDSKFLEIAPLYKKFEKKFISSVGHLEKVRINMDCHHCKEVRTFAMKNEYWEKNNVSNSPTFGESFRLDYICLSCQEFRREFLIRIAKDGQSVIKIGQFPPWEIAPDKGISEMLGTRSEYLKKALVCESQSYGIAAFSYYRRIVEEVIDELLESVVDILDDGQKSLYEKALADVRQTRQTSEKIDLVKDLLPPILRPNGHNPLGILHGVLSEGLHAESDDKCLEYATEIREILRFLIGQIELTKQQSKVFTSSMQSLLEKKAAKGGTA